MHNCVKKERNYGLPDSGIPLLDTNWEFSSIGQFHDDLRL